MRKSLSALTLLGAAALALTACTGGGAPAGSGGPDTRQLAEGKTFTAIMPADPGSLDPFKAAGTGPRSITRFLYAQLLDTKPDGTLTTGLAAKWQADTTTATFTLRDDLVCADGTPLTATDVAANITFMSDPANASVALGTQLMPGTTAKADEKARTVVVTSSAPDAFLAYNVGTLPIVCGTEVTNEKARAKGEGATGMYRIAEIRPNSRYALARNQKFVAGPEGWDPKAKGQPKEVVFAIVPSESTAVNMLLSGEATMVSVAGPDIKRLQANRALFHAPWNMPVGQFMVNTAAGRPTSDLQVRKALFQALDLNEARKVITGGDGKPMTSLVSLAPNPCRGADTVTDNLPAHDAAAAAKTLDAAGWVKGADGIRVKNGKKLSLRVPYQAGGGGETLVATMEMVQQAWQDLGAEVTITGMDGNTTLTTFYETKDWDVTMMSLMVPLPSMFVPFWSGPVPKAGLNLGDVHNPEFDAAVAKARAQTGTKGCGDWQDAERAVVKGLDTVPFAVADRGPYASKATFVFDTGVAPTTIRMYQ